MPYIEPHARAHFATTDWPTAGSAGELNYVITRIIDDYFHENGGRYQQINDIVGALEGAKLEFYRRVVAPYEDDKSKANGDVYLPASTLHETKENT